MKLPTVTVSVFSRNPEWIVNSNLPYDQRMEGFYINHTTQAEVLTIHFQKCKMRIRYKDACGQTQIDDIDAKAFFMKYNITEQ
jgi:hypothetical protein